MNRIRHQQKAQPDGFFDHQAQAAEYREAMRELGLHKSQAAPGSWQHLVFDAQHAAVQQWFLTHQRRIPRLEVLDAQIRDKHDELDGLESGWAYRWTYPPVAAVTLLGVGLFVLGVWDGWVPGSPEMVRAGLLWLSQWLLWAGLAIGLGAGGWIAWMIYARREDAIEMAGVVEELRPLEQERTELLPPPLSDILNHAQNVALGGATDSVVFVESTRADVVEDKEGGEPPPQVEATVLQLPVTGVRPARQASTSAARALGLGGE